MEVCSLVHVKYVQRQMRSDYEYETGRLKGVNEAILRQNQEMRLKIINQNKRIQEVKKVHEDHTDFIQ